MAGVWGKAGCRGIGGSGGVNGWACKCIACERLHGDLIGFVFVSRLREGMNECV